VCSDNTGSTLDTCDGSDDDCDPASADGSEDPLNGAPCDGADSDLCIEGINSCSGGALVCSDNTGSTLDVCNGSDDDCDAASADGDEDPLNGAPCDGFDSDLCLEGLISCLGGALVCSDNTGDDLELCDGLNNDCNGATPDGIDEPTLGNPCDGPDSDLCEEGLNYCNGAAGMACDDTTGNNVEICNGFDDDCDGTPDNGMTPPPNSNQNGACAGSVQTCTGAGGWVDDYSSVPGYGLPENPDPSYIDSNCDGIDGDVSNAWFVATNGNDGAAGSMSAPFRTIGRAMTAAASGEHIYVSNGTYNEVVTLKNGVSMWGGFSRGNGWARNPSYIATISSSTVSSGRMIAVYGINTTTAATIEDLSITTGSTSSIGVDVYSLYCNNCDGLTLSRLNITAGSAGPGSNGSNGTNGAPTMGAGNNGGAGSCDGSNGSGGAGATSPCGNHGGDGGNGGAEGCNDGQDGDPGIGAGGAGGFGGDHDEDTGFTCNARGDPGTFGSPGTNGPSGGNGAGGSGGFVSGGYWNTNNGINGSSGFDGGGGGGGGGGGAQCGLMCNDGGGNGGGGGGGGGCGATRGTRGGGGGGSFGLFLYNSTGIVVQNSSIASGNGGNGGTGGTGGTGGSGSNGGSGASVCTGEVGRGGNGGLGGDGGDGGHGGGGAGGPSYTVYRSGTTVSLVGNLLSFGSGGSGGSSAGNNGSDGASGQTN
jgi:hypothetical protein